MTTRRLIVYIRGTFCPDVRRTRDFLAAHAVTHEEIDAERDLAAKERVIGWTGFMSFPTLVVADGDSIEPYEPPLPLRPGQSPRDIDRGSMLTEASLPVLESFLRRHGFLN